MQTVLAAASPAPKFYEAYDLYLQGRYFWNKRTVDGFHRSVDCFEQAIRKDPGYARAYAGLADSYALMAAYYIAPQNELIPKARAASLKALELDGNRPRRMPRSPLSRGITIGTGRPPRRNSVAQSPSIRTMPRDISGMPSISLSAAGSRSPSRRWSMPGN